MFSSIVKYDVLEKKSNFFSKGGVSLKTQINSVKKRNFVVFLMRYPLEVARFRAEIVDLANVGVQREPDRNTDEKFCRFTPETFA